MEFVVLAVLFGTLGLLAFGMLWQERRRVPEPSGAVVYSVEDSIDFVWDRLGEEQRSMIGRSDVRRILEWEMHYLQGARPAGATPVVGSVEAAEHIQRMAYEQGHAYEPASIFAVLDLQAEYLAAIGAVGGAVEGDG